MDESIPYLSVVVPAYNEARGIRATLSAIREYLDRQPWAYEVIVVADGDDGTRERAEEWAAGDQRIAVLGHTQRTGKGRGVREGILRARGQIIGFVDADYKTPIEEFARLLPFFDEGYDLVIGSRKAASARVEKRQPLHRRLGSRAFAFVMHRMVGLGAIGDTQCGFKFFRRKAARRIFSLQRVDGYMFDVEVLRLAGILGYRVREVGVRWRDDGDSRYHPFWGTIRNAKELLTIRRMTYDLSKSHP